MKSPSPGPQPLSPLKRALLALEEMQRRLERAENRRAEPIAVLGMGCRFPGAADDPPAFWKVLRDGLDTVGDIPAERWDAARHYDPQPGRPGKMYVRRGSFLGTVDAFDAGFFRISPREAVLMDPQQRLLLEVGWEALENAGLAPEALSGTAVGVYMGVMTDDYLKLCLKAGDPELLGAHFVTGTSMSFAAGRLSYFLGVHGPSLAVDTACSSSLVAVHLACRGLRAGDCDLALAGGVNLILSPELYVTLSQFRALSADGRCRTFDAAADGFGRGEGCGVVVLKRLSDALADGDRVDALILGSAVNHDGPSSGLTVPNGLAQQALLRRALADAGLPPGRVGFVEAHGTGTSLGDPIEARALAAVYAEGRPPSDPLRIGSAKATIGHLDSAAGVAGLIKAILSLQREEIPPQPNLRQVNPHIPLDEFPLEIAARLIPWPAGDAPRAAGVSAFGLSGTNAHVILGEAPPAPVEEAAAERGAYLLCLSAKTERALREMAGRYAAYLRRSDAARPVDVAFTAHTGRSHFGCRLAVHAPGAQAVRERLEAFAEGRPTGGVCSGQTAARPPKVAFMFTGQGAQMPGMGRQLYETQPLFRRILDDCDQKLRGRLEKPLLSVIFPQAGDESLLQQTCYTQPALFAFEYALASLWRSWGVAPAACIGHSVGEYVAACVAGVFSMEDGLRLTAERGRLIHELPQEGAMLALPADERRVGEHLAPLAESVSIAAVNGPRQTVISGRREVLRRVAADLEALGIRGTALKVSHAFHSPLMEPILERFLEKARQVRYAAPQIDIVSNVTGRRAAADEICDPAYWQRHVREPVMFYAGVQSIERLGADVVVEVGPRPILTALARDCVSREMIWLPTLTPGRGEWEQMLESLGALYVAGAAVDWPAFHRGDAPRRVALPTYPFQRERYWISPPETVAPSAGAGPGRVDVRAGAPAEGPGRGTEDAGHRTEAMNRPAPAGHGAPALKIPEDRWYYETLWEPRPAGAETGPPRPDSPGTWVLFSRRGDDAARLAQRLEELGEAFVIVRGGRRLDRLGAGEWGLRRSEPRDYGRILERAAADARFPLRGVVWMGTPDLNAPESLTAGGILEGQRELCGGLLHLLHALTRRSASAPGRVRLVVATRGARAVDTPADMSGFCGASLWGVGQVAALEYPDLGCLRVDLDPREAADPFRDLAFEICRAQPEDQVAFRNGRRFVARLARRPPQARNGGDSRILLRPDGTYWVTGGLSGLGLQVVRWMVSRGARHVVVIARSAGTEKARRVLSDLGGAGVNLAAAAADVAHEEQLGEALGRLRDSMPPLRGVVHSAGVLDDGALFQQTWERFEKVMAPKLAGAWNLHRLTRHDPLDFFVLFSSTASVLGAAGQANYAAANALMDGLAHYRRSLGRPAASINWGPWSEVGMAAKAGERDQQRLMQQGMEFIAPADGLSALERLMQADATQTAVLPIDWRRYRMHFPQAGRSPFLARMDGALEAAPAGGPGRTGRKTALRAEAPPAERREAVEARLLGHVATVMQLRAERVDRGRPLTEMGLDSIMALELENRIASELKVAVPMTVFLEGISTDRLLEIVMGQLAGSAGGTPACRARDPGPAAAPPDAEPRGFEGHVDRLSDTEVDRLLQMMLSQEKPSS